MKRGGFKNINEKQKKKKKKKKKKKEKIYMRRIR